MSLIFVASHLSHCAYGEKNLSYSEDRNGVGEHGAPCRHAGGGFSALTHAAVAAHVCMEMRMSLNLRSIGKQINKCGFRLQILQ